jgi:hypothetical protein
MRAYEIFSLENVFAPPTDRVLEVGGKMVILRMWGKRVGVGFCGSASIK